MATGTDPQSAHKSSAEKAQTCQCCGLPLSRGRCAYCEEDLCPADPCTAVSMKGDFMEQPEPLDDLRTIVERIKSDRVVSVLKVGTHAKDYLISYGRAARWIDYANEVNPVHRLLGTDVVLDPTMDPRAWRFVSQSGEVLGEGVVPVTLADGERIGGALLNDDGTVTCYIANEKIWRGVSTVDPGDLSGV